MSFEARGLEKTTKFDGLPFHGFREEGKNEIYEEPRDQKEHKIRRIITNHTWGMQ